MTISKKYPAVFFLIMLFGSVACSQSTAEPTQTAIPTPDPTPLLGRWIWQSATLANGTEVELYSTATFEPNIIFMTETDLNGDYDKSYKVGGGKAGCNGFGFFYKLEPNGAMELQPGVQNEVLCVPEQMSLDELWWELSGQISRYEIKDDQLILTSPAGDRLIFVREKLSPEAKIYRDIINDWGSGTQGSFLIIDEFAFNREGVSLEETRAQLLDNPILGISRGVTDEVWGAFADAQQTANNPADILGDNLSFISKAKYDDVFQNGNEAGWSTLRQQMPQIQTIFTFSAVGITDSKILVHYSVRTPHTHSGYIYFDDGITIATSNLWDDTVHPATSVPATITPYPEP